MTQRTGPLREYWTLRVWMLLVLSLAIPAHVSSAQGLLAMQPLAIPEGVVLKCRAVRASSHDTLPAGSTSWEFEMGQPGFASRDVTVSLDSMERPLRLLEINVELAEGRTVVHGVSMWFAPKGGVVGFHYRTDQGASPPTRDSTALAARFAKTTKPLSPEEQRRAGVLATWLAAHHCGRRSSGVATPDRT